MATNELVFELVDDAVTAFAEMKNAEKQIAFYSDLREMKFYRVGRYSEQIGRELEMTKEQALELIIARIKVIRDGHDGV